MQLPPSLKGPRPFERGPRTARGSHKLPRKYKSSVKTQRNNFISFIETSISSPEKSDSPLTRGYVKKEIKLDGEKSQAECFPVS